MFKDFVNMTLLSVTHTKITEVGSLIGKTRSLLTGGLKTIPQYISLEFPIIFSRWQQKILAEYIWEFRFKITSGNVVDTLSLVWSYVYCSLLFYRIDLHDISLDKQEIYNEPPASPQTETPNQRWCCDLELTKSFNIPLYQSVARREYCQLAPIWTSINIMQLLKIYRVWNIILPAGLRTTALKELHLNDNRIYQIDRMVFMGLYNLQTLRLHNNRISHVGIYLWYFAALC